MQAAGAPAAPNGRYVTKDKIRLTVTDGLITAAADAAGKPIALETLEPPK